MKILNIGDKVRIKTNIEPGPYKLKESGWYLNIFSTVKFIEGKICTINGIYEKSEEVKQPIYCFEETDNLLTEEFFMPLNSIAYFLYEKKVMK